MFLSSCGAKEDSKYDIFQGYKSLKDEKTGWFHVNEIEGRWYFITPEGNAFFSLGATHAVECIKLDELNLFETKYHSNEVELSENFLHYFGIWGYNSAGYGALPSMEKQIPYVVEVWTEGPRSLSAGKGSVNTDIFDPAVQEKLRKTVRDSALKHVNNPNCLGYVGIDLPLWGTVVKNGISYIDFFRSLENNTYGKKEYLSFLNNKYKEKEKAFLDAYGLNLNSLKDLSPEQMAEISPLKNQVINADDEEFLNIVADTYFNCYSSEIRKADPNHLVLGDRFMAASESQQDIKVPESILKTASKYFDVISFQPMGTRDFKKKYINRVFEITGRPILMADVNCMLSRPTEGQTNTEAYEKEAGEHTYKFYTDAAQSPYLIGIHRCTVRDYRPWDKKYHRRGLLKANDEPYPILADYTIKTNQEVFSIVYNHKNK